MKHTAHTTIALVLLNAACGEDAESGSTPPQDNSVADDNGNGNGNGNGSDDGGGGSGGAGNEPTLADARLSVRTVVSGLTEPIGIAFLTADDFFVTEKSTGKVKRVVDGKVSTTVLDLPVNSAEERGLLGIALHPRFADNGWVYLYWTESSTGDDSDVLEQVGNPDSEFAPGTPHPLGNRVDRFVWDSAAETLTFDQNLVVLRAYQDDADQPARGNHNGGVIRFAAKGEDESEDEPAKLYVIIGDNGRRGLLQNLKDGPFRGDKPDDQFGGPEPDDSHLTGVVLRLNDDGTTPSDNPFFDAAEDFEGEAKANLRKVFAYGIRNSFGMAVDPESGRLWESENGDDAFDEINRIVAGHNGGWIQAMGPLDRLDEWKAIEEETEPASLQQLRWPPSRIAESSVTARARMVQLEGSRYHDPEFSWKYAVAPAAIGFVHGDSLGRGYDGDLIVGAATPALLGGYLFRLPLAVGRRHVAPEDPALDDLVADNSEKFDPAESESLAFGENFGITTDIQTGPLGNLFVVSTSNGAVYEIYQR